MKYILIFLVSLISTVSLFSQEANIPLVTNLDLEGLESGKTHKLWISLAEDHLSNSIKIPVLVAKGKEKGSVLGITAAIHGNELNGVAIIHELFESIDPQNLQGTIIGIAGLNPLAIANYQREFIDGVDLNRIFPGKANGDQSEQMAYEIGQKVISFLDYHVDLHTASFGRTNSLYGRGDMQNDTLANMLLAFSPDIIVSNKGNASFGSASGLTMRAFAIEKGVKSITLEYGNPQVYQKEMIKRGVDGLQNLMVYLGYIKGDAYLSKQVNICSKSYWIYTDKGGYLDVLVDLNQKIKKNDTLAVLRNSFGAVITIYRAPEDGIIVGKSTNPVAISGSRMVHLGILE